MDVFFHLAIQPCRRWDVIGDELLPDEMNLVRIQMTPRFSAAEMLLLFVGISLRECSGSGWFLSLQGRNTGVFNCILLNKVCVDWFFTT